MIDKLLEVITYILILSSCALPMAIIGAVWSVEPLLYVKAAFTAAIIMMSALIAGGITYHMTH